MKICIFGAGATGGHLAVKLATGGHDVSVIARGDHLEAIRARGLTLKMGDRILTASVVASDDPNELGSQDLVVVTVKATDLGTVADHLAPLVLPSTAVIFSQNGMPWWYPLELPDKPPPPDLPIFRRAAVFLSYLLPQQIIGGTLFSGNQVIEPGVIRNDSPARNRLDLGPVSRECSVDMDGLRALLEEVGVSSPASDADIRSLIWSKLLFNMSASALALATGCESSICRKDHDLAIVFRRIMREGLAITAAHGFPLHDRVDIEQILANIPDHKPSLLQDFERSRPMEIGEIVRAPQAFARTAGIQTPSLDTVCAIVTRMARERGLYDG